MRALPPHVVLWLVVVAVKINDYNTFKGVQEIYYVIMYDVIVVSLLVVAYIIYAVHL